MIGRGLRPRRGWVAPGAVVVLFRGVELVLPFFVSFERILSIGPSKVISRGLRGNRGRRSGPMTIVTVKARGSQVRRVIFLR